MGWIFWLFLVPRKAWSGAFLMVIGLMAVMVVMTLIGDAVSFLSGK